MLLLWLLWPYSSRLTWNFWEGQTGCSEEEKKKTATNITTCLVLSDFVCLDADQIYYKYLTGRCKGIMHIFCTMQQKWQREPHTFAGNCLLQSSIVYMHSLAVWKHEKLSAWFCRNPGCKTLVNTIVPAHGEREIFEVLLHVAQVTNKLKSMSHTTQQLLQEVLQRLETDHGVDLVSTTLSLLICTRDGTYQLLPFLSLGYT